MDPRDLLTLWDRPDHSRLTARQWSIRLPVQVAARINALCDLFPRKTKTEIIGDLLATALDQLESALPDQGRAGDARAAGRETGLRGRFARLTSKHLADLENDRDA